MKLVINGQEMEFAEGASALDVLDKLPKEVKKEALVARHNGKLVSLMEPLPGDGELEIVIRTRWPEKPYTVYDMVNGEVVAVDWPDTVLEAVREQLKCIWEQ